MLNAELKARVKVEYESDHEEDCCHWYCTVSVDGISAQASGYFQSIAYERALAKLEEKLNNKN